MAAPHSRQQSSGDRGLGHARLVRSHQEPLLDLGGGAHRGGKGCPRHLSPSNAQVGGTPLPPAPPSTAPDWAARRPLDSGSPPLWVPGPSAPPKMNHLLRLGAKFTPGDPRRILGSVSERGTHQSCSACSSFQKLHRSPKEPHAGEPAGRTSHRPRACTPGPLPPEPHFAPPVAQRGSSHPSARACGGLGHSGTREAGGADVLRQHARTHSHTSGAAT